VRHHVRARALLPQQQHQQQACLPKAPRTQASNKARIATAACTASASTAKPHGQEALASASAAGHDTSTHGNNGCGPEAGCATACLVEAYAAGGKLHLGEVLDLCAYEEALILGEEEGAMDGAVGKGQQGVVGENCGQVNCDV